MIINKPILKDLPIEYLKRGQYQTRKHFDEALLQELALSIQSQGLIQPIVVRPLTDNFYEIIAGERRWRAAQLAHLEIVPCLIRSFNNEQAAAVTVIENIQREDLNPIEEAMSYQTLIDEFNYFHEEIAAIMGVSRAKITNALRLLKLDKKIQKMLEDKVLSLGHGKVLAGVDEKFQYLLAEKCVAKGWSVRHLEQEAKKSHCANTAAIATSQDPNILLLERHISEFVGSEVKIEGDVNNPSGWMKIRYFDNETLAGLLEKIGLQLEK